MRRLLVMLGWSVLVPLSAAGAQQPGPNYFAQRFALRLDGSAAYYAVTVPQAVYAASRRSDLGDVRVFNGAGEPVPYALETPIVSAKAPPPARQTVPWFPLPPSRAGQQGAPAGIVLAQDGTLRVAGRAPEPGSHDADLIDTGSVSGHVSALLIHLQDDSYQGSVSVESSDDLRTWHALTEASLLKVNAGGHALVQERIPVDGLGARYVRLHWLDRAPAIASVEMEVQANPNPAAPVADTRQWHDGLVARAGHAAGEYLFETTGAYPVDRLRFNVPQLNTLTHAVVYSRTGAAAPWQEVAQAVLYRLQGAAGERRNPPLEFAPDSNREWRVVVDARQGGLGSGALTVAVGWQPASLTFVARGAPPFTLAVGNSKLVTAALPREELLIGTTPVIATAQVGEALPGPPGESNEAADEGGDTRRRYVLWAALLLAVGVLGAMAWRLMRQR